ncbi:MAG: VCBS repeat-containing protein, partial [Flavobacteriales bacterium]|nr:VCBS repeat-containing protein [Flavobacteriales bacterium]
FLPSRSPAWPLAVTFVLCQTLASAQFGPQQRIECSSSISLNLVDEGDIDGDGDVDLLLDHSQFVRWMPNTGDGRFLPQRDLHGGGRAGEGRLSDLDLDGDLDFVSTFYSTSYPGGIIWYENLGGGDFAPGDTLQSASEVRHMVVADLDLDGDSDLVCWNGIATGGPLLVLYNQGQATFSPAMVVDTNSTAVRNAEVTDVNGDGLPDIVVGELGISWYPSLGTSFGAAQSLPTSYGAYRVASGDIDADGDIDLISTSLAGHVWKHTNLGGGLFATQVDLVATNYAPAPPWVGDLDQDGALDILFGDNAISTNNLGWLRGQGNGLFDPPIYLGPASATVHVPVVDVNGDGLPDVLSKTYFGAVRVFPATGGGAFGSPRPILQAPREYRNVACGDLDGDGDQDVLASVYDQDRLVWFRNGGNATFGLEDTLTNNSGMASYLHIADLNGDGDQDVVFRQDAPNKIAWCENLGAGVFSDTITIALASLSDGERFGVGDLDGDGDTDLVLHTAFGQVQRFLNDGAGTFTPDSVLHQGSGRSIKCLDFDADGDQDLLMVISGYTSLFLNDGMGDFTMTLHDWNPGPNIFLEAVDLDKDGLMDVLSIDGNYWSMWLNNGDSTFTRQAGAPGVGNYTQDAILGDVDLDGLPELVRSWQYTNLDLPYLVVSHQLATPGFTNGTLIDEGEFHLGEDVTVALADLDNDGDLDVISASSAIGMLACYLNQAIGPYRIEGAAFHDANTNGVRDAAEPTLPLMQMAITPGMPQFFCGADGHFSRNVPAGTYTVTALPPAPYWTHTTPDAFTVTLADTIPLAQGLEFGFSLPDTTLLDPSVVLLAAGCADTATIHASVRNLAAPVQNGELVLELDPALTYVNATPAPTTQVGDTLTWSFQDLEPLDQEAVQVRVVMPSSSTLPYELNMPITASSALVPTLFQDTLQRPLSCTQGANDKLVDPAGLGSIGAVPLATTDLEYTIRFRNTGNAPVQSILITDQLDTQLDTASLQPVAW